jgi:hypothetical protein
MSLYFILGVSVIANIFTVFDTFASNEKPEKNIVHGVISLNLNGEAYVKQFDGRWDEDIVIPMDKGYDPLEIVTITYKGNRIVDHSLTTGKEIETLTRDYGAIIDEYKHGIIQALYK